MPDHDDLINLTADIVSAMVSNNKLAPSDLPALISSTYAALARTGAPVVAEAAQQEPAVSVRASIKRDYLVCLEDGKKLKMLKRYLMTRYQMTPDDYRAKWGLPKDYPMVAPAYAEQRRTLAHAIGLGRKAGAKLVDGAVSVASAAVEAVAEVLPEAVTPKRGRGRPKKVATPVPAPTAEKKTRGRPRKLTGAAALAKVREKASEEA